MREDLIQNFNCYKHDYFYLPKTDYVRILDSIVGTYLVSDTMTLTMDVILTRDVAFDNLLPTTGSVNYMETKQCDSIIQCAAVCVCCAG